MSAENGSWVHISGNTGTTFMCELKMIEGNFGWLPSHLMITTGFDLTAGKTTSTGRLRESACRLINSTQAAKNE